MTAENIPHPSDENDPMAAASPARVAERYLNGIGDVYKKVGRCSCKGSDLQLTLPGEQSRASVSYIGGVVMIVGDKVGDFDIFSMSDEGLVVHNTLDDPHLADRGTVDRLFEERLASPQLYEA
jgi:hypothetical protein